MTHCPSSGRCATPLPGATTLPSRNRQARVVRGDSILVQHYQLGPGSTAPAGFWCHIPWVPTDIPVDLARALESRYELRELLGRGGMATVYLAHDRKHQRVVALKVLRSELSATIGAERFLKESKTSPSLPNPHTLPRPDPAKPAKSLSSVIP